MTLPAPRLEHVCGLAVTTVPPIDMGYSPAGLGSEGMPEFAAKQAALAGGWVLFGQDALVTARVLRAVKATVFGEIN